MGDRTIVALGQQEIDDIVAFLHTLTDGYVSEGSATLGYGQGYDAGAAMVYVPQVQTGRR